MKLCFPLYAKILFWFFLNLLLLGMVFYAVFRVQFHLGLDSLLAGRAGDRIQAASELITAELNDRSPAQWDDVLKRFSSAYRVQFFLFQNEGEQIAGEIVKLPPPVHTRLTEGRGPGLPRREPDAEMSPPPPRDEPPFELRPPRRGIQPGGPRSKIMLHTSDPNRYWVLVRMPLNEPGRPHPLPATLVAMSSSLSAGGLFFDFTPWLAAGVGVVVFSLLFWFPLVRGITRSVSQMTHATEQIAEGRFDVRVNSNRGDELGLLSQAINRMAARLAGFVAGQKRFLGDTAHELCSPLARIQMASGILEQRADEKQKSCVEDLREEVQQMSNLVNELLSFSKASLGAPMAKLQPASLRSIVDKAIRREAFENEKIQINVEENLRVLAEPELLLRAVSNLLRNAIRYAGDAGPILVSAERTNGEVTLTVADSGPGVPETALAQIFDPFFRLDPSRDRETGGVGLGLAIVKTCVESCRGTVTCRNRQPSGLEVVIKLSAAFKGSAAGH